MKRGVVVSDLHVGSIYGLLPPHFTDSNGIIVPQNGGQGYTWLCWKDFCGRARAYEPDFIILNGDLVDGKQQAQRQTELSLPLITDQKRAAVETLEALKWSCPSAKIYVVQGTTYHVGDAAEWEEAIAQEIGAEQYHSIGTGRFCKEVLWLDVEGVILEAAHHISVSTGFYRSTAMDREMQWSAMSAKDASKGIPKADFLIRSHVHYFNLVEHSSKQGVITPCWQLQTKFMRKNSVGRMLPDIGGIFLEIDGTAKQKGEAPVRCVKELYKLPPMPVAVL